MCYRLSMLRKLDFGLVNIVCVVLVCLCVLVGCLCGFWMLRKDIIVSSLCR